MTAGVVTGDAAPLPFDRRRAVLWRALWRHHFRHRIGAQDCVLDLGCGYGDFINAVVARRRVAVDRWPGMAAHLAAGVEGHVGDVGELGFLADGSVDFVLASNVFEHLERDHLARVLAALAPKLSARGILTVIQPNWRHAWREYFDDCTHVSVYSHATMRDFLTVNGYDVIEVVPRFLPLTLRSWLPVHPALIAAYLASPFRPFGKQMMLRARTARAR